jgi:hypothetical protein
LKEAAMSAGVAAVGTAVISAEGRGVRYVAGTAAKRRAAVQRIAIVAAETSVAVATEGVHSRARLERKG